MNKKRIIIFSSVAVVIVCISLIVLYGRKEEEVETKSTLYNVEKLEEQDNKEVSNFFLKCLNYTFNIADIQNKEILADSIRFQQENFKNFEYAQNFESLYSKTSMKSLGISKYNLLDIKKGETELSEDGEVKIEYYTIVYELSLSYAGEKERKVGTAEEPCEAVVAIEKGKCKLVKFFTKWVRL